MAAAQLPSTRGETRLTLGEPVEELAPGEPTWVQAVAAPAARRQVERGRVAEALVERVPAGQLPAERAPVARALVEWAPLERAPVEQWEVEAVPRAAAAALQARLVQRAVVAEMPVVQQAQLVQRAQRAVEEEVLAQGEQQVQRGQLVLVAEAEALVRLVQEARRVQRAPVEPVALLSLPLRAARPTCALTVAAAPEVPVT